MSSLMEDTLLNLKVISKLTEYDCNSYRINVLTGRPVIQKIGVFSWVSRAFSGESRLKTVEYLSKVFRQCDDLVQITICSTKMVLPPNVPLTVYQRDKAANMIASLRTLSQELENSIGGLEAVQGTYQGDSTVSSQIELLISQAQSMIIRIARKVEETDAQLADRRAPKRAVDPGEREALD
jgi:hypothetical protein